MKLQRFFIEQKIDEGANVVVENVELCHQLRNVFRFSVGDRLILLDNSGFEFVSEITNLQKNEVVFAVAEKNGDKLTSPYELTLYCSLVKRNNFELIAEKCTELGISRIVPIISDRSEKKGINLERLKKISREASEQSGRFRLPIIDDISFLNEIVAQVLKHPTKKLFPSLVLHPYSKTSVSSFLKNKGETQENMGFFIGPEGGWSDREILLFENAGVKLLSLGQGNILRTETAAIVATALLLTL
jgi:16S rRNA (uracil1498-N3)-methyltransferase